MRNFYYVSVRDGKKWGLLLGPFPTHEQALSLVEPAREKAYELNNQAFWYAYGTCQIYDLNLVKPGILNDYFDVEKAIL